MCIRDSAQDDRALQTCVNSLYLTVCAVLLFVNLQYVFQNVTPVSYTHLILALFSLMSCISALKASSVSSGRRIYFSGSPKKPSRLRCNSSRRKEPRSSWHKKKKNKIISAKKRKLSKR